MVTFETMDPQAWVEHTTVMIAREVGLTIENAGWLKRTPSDNERDIDRYLVRSNGRDVFIPIGSDKLSDLRADPKVRTMLASRIREALENLI